MRIIENQSTFHHYLGAWNRLRFVKHKQLKTSAKSTQKKKKFFVSVEHRAIPQFLISYWLCPLKRRQASQAQREREQQRARERRRNCSDEQREREQERNRERRCNFTYEQREREQERNRKGGAILLTSYGRGSKKEAQKEGAALMTSNGRERERERNRENWGAISLTSNGREQERSRERRRNEVRAMKTAKPQIHFLREVLPAVGVLVS